MGLTRATIPAAIKSNSPVRAILLAAERSRFGMYHIHMLITIGTRYSVGQHVRRIKQATTIKIWKTFPYLKNQLWKEKTFWSGGYFVCSVGNASAETTRKYIQEQG